MSDEQTELDFNEEDYKSFYYTNEKYLRKLDDEFIIAKIIEKFPDFNQDRKDSVVKQSFIFFLKDSRHVKYILDYFQISIYDLFSVIYRTYSYIFNPCFTNKVHNIIRNKCYVKRTRPTM